MTGRNWGVVVLKWQAAFAGHAQWGESQAILRMTDGGKDENHKQSRSFSSSIGTVSPGSTVIVIYGIQFMLGTEGFVRQVL